MMLQMFKYWQECKKRVSVLCSVLSFYGEADVTGVCVVRSKAGLRCHSLEAELWFLLSLFTPQHLQ